MRLFDDCRVTWLGRCLSHLVELGKRLTTLQSYSLLFFGWNDFVTLARICRKHLLRLQVELLVQIFTTIIGLPGPRNLIRHWCLSTFAPHLISWLLTYLKQFLAIRAISEKPKRSNCFDIYNLCAASLLFYWWELGGSMDEALRQSALAVEVCSFCARFL